MTSPADNSPLLILSTMGIPLYSSRGLVQTLTAVPESKPRPRYTINGELVHIGLNSLRRYESVITCVDQQAPAFGGLWIGQAVTVNCVVELAYKTVGGSPERTVVSGSSHVVGDFTLYRPQISFMCVDWELGMAEYGHDYQWKLTLMERGA